MRRGEIFWADLAPRSGSEQQGRRPVIIVSHDGFNQVEEWRSVIVVPVSTSRAQRRRGPTAIEMPVGAGGLPRSSAALCHQITTLDRAKLSQRIGAIEPELLRRIEAGIRAAIDIE